MGVDIYILCVKHREYFHAIRQWILHYFYGRVKPDLIARMKEVIEAEEPDLGPHGVKYHERILALIDAFITRHSDCVMRICPSDGMQAEIMIFDDDWEKFSLWDDPESRRLATLRQIEDEEKRVEEAQTKVESLRERMERASGEEEKTLQRKLDKWESRLEERKSLLRMEQEAVKRAESARKQSSESMDLLETIASTPLKQPLESLDDWSAEIRKLEVVSGEPEDFDHVFYSSAGGHIRAGLLEIKQRRLHFLAPRVWLRSLEDGTPVEIDIEGHHISWDIREKMRLGVPVRPGKVRFKGPRGTCYWFEDNPTIASNPEGTMILVDFGQEPPSEGIRISPRVVVLFSGSGKLSGFCFNDILIDGSLDPLPEIDFGDLLDQDD